MQTVCNGCANDAGTAELLLMAQLLVMAGQQKTQLPNLASTLHVGIDYSNRSSNGA
jgi:hypothetical protein